MVHWELMKHYFNHCVCVPLHDQPTPMFLFKVVTGEVFAPSSVRNQTWPRSEEGANVWLRPCPHHARCEGRYDHGLQP